MLKNQSNISRPASEILRTNTGDEFSFGGPHLSIGQVASRLGMSRNDVRWLAATGKVLYSEGWADGLRIAEQQFPMLETPGSGGATHYVHPNIAPLTNYPYRAHPHAYEAALFTERESLGGLSIVGYLIRRSAGDFGDVEKAVDALLAGRFLPPR